MSDTPIIPQTQPHKNLTAQVETLGAPAPCHLSVVTFGNNGLVTIKRDGKSLRIYLSGNRYELASQLEQLAQTLKR